MDMKKYQFGAGWAELINESAAVSQIWARNKLRNKLVELDRKTRKQFNIIVDVQNPEGDRISEIAEELAEARKRLKILRIPNPGDPRRVAKSGSLIPDSNKTGYARLSDSIKGLINERENLRPISVATKLANRSKYSEAISKLNADYYEELSVLRREAIKGYTYTDRYSANAIIVPALHEFNAEEIIDQHDRERGRAMKEHTELRFHGFQGEGRIFQRIKAQRGFSGKDGKATEAKFRALMAEVKAHKKARKQEIGKCHNSNEKKEVSAHYRALIEKLLEGAEDIAPLKIGISDEELFSGKSNSFRVDPVNLRRDSANPTVWDKSLPRAEQRKRMRTVAHIRIGTEATKKRVERNSYLSVPIVLHRPFPIGARIISAAANRKKIGRKFRWTVEFTLRIPEISPRTVRNGSVLAIDLGWAKDSLPNADGRLRVAGVRERAEDGSEKSYEIALPPSYDSAIKKYRELHSLIDQHTNEAFALLAASTTIGGCSQELQALLARAEQSRKQRAEHPPIGHLRHAVQMIRKGEQVSDEAKNILERWHERYMHLSEWLANGRDNVQAFRNDFYRRTAYKLAQQNGLLLLDPDNFSRMAKTPNPEEDARVVAGDKRTSVAPSVLRNYLIEAFGKNVLWACSLFSSRTCSACGHVNEKLGAGRTFTCSSCGFTADRESNATQNIMNAYVAQPGIFSADKNVAEKFVEAKEKEVIEESAKLAIVA